MAQYRYLLLQIRNAEDPMRHQEVGCFAQALGCDRSDITPWDLLRDGPSNDTLSEFDAVFVGGSGEYSVEKGGPWLPSALDSMKRIANSGKPMFASCWGFQALARALGGEVVHQHRFAELGTKEITLTPAGQTDPVFAVAGRQFRAHSGHEDTVLRLPSEAILLASSQRVANQALKLQDRPVYATQFHPELRLEAYLARLEAYPRYVTQITGLSGEEFAAQCVQTPESNKLLGQFLREVVAAS